jgi:hypothetical protein
MTLILPFVAKVIAHVLPYSRMRSLTLSRSSHPGTPTFPYGTVSSSTSNPHAENRSAVTTPLPYIYRRSAPEPRPAHGTHPHSPHSPHSLHSPHSPAHLSPLSALRSPAHFADAQERQANALPPARIGVLPTIRGSPIGRSVSEPRSLYQQNTSASREGEISHYLTATIRRSAPSGRDRDLPEDVRGGGGFAAHQLLLGRGGRVDRGRRRSATTIERMSPLRLPSPDRVHRGDRINRIERGHDDDEPGSSTTTNLGGRTAAHDRWAQGATGAWALGRGRRGRSPLRIELGRSHSEGEVHELGRTPPPGPSGRGQTEEIPYETESPDEASLSVVRKEIGFADLFPRLVDGGHGRSGSRSTSRGRGRARGSIAGRGKRAMTH